MAKKTHVKVRLVPESKPDSPFFYYVKKPAGGEKAKVKLSAKKYNPELVIDMATLTGSAARATPNRLLPTTSGFPKILKSEDGTDSASDKPLYSMALPSPAPKMATLAPHIPPSSTSLRSTPSKALTCKANWDKR